MLGHAVGDAFAAGQASLEELVGVGAVGLGAGGADAGAAVAAGHQQDPAGLVLGAVDLAQLPGGPVGLVSVAVEADGVGAVVDARGGVLERVVAVGVAGQVEDVGQ
jgi:hypothetical protein